MEQKKGLQTHLSCFVHLFFIITAMSNVWWGDGDSQTLSLRMWLARSCFTILCRDACSLQWHFPTLFFVVTDLNCFSERFAMNISDNWRENLYPNFTFIIARNGKTSFKWSLFGRLGTFRAICETKLWYSQLQQPVQSRKAFCPSVTKKEAEVEEERGRGRETVRP